MSPAISGYCRFPIVLGVGGGREGSTPVALETFNKGEGGFLERDLHVFCANMSDGKIVAQGQSERQAITRPGSEDTQGCHRQVRHMAKEFIRLAPP